MSGDVSTGIARFTTGHKLSVLRAQQSKVHSALEKLDSEVTSLQLPSPDERSKEDWCKVLELQEQCLEKVSKSYRQAAQKQLLEDIKAFRSIARFDPSLDVEQCAGTSQRLSDSLAKASTQSDLAVLFCDVLQQWLETDGAKSQETTGIPFNPPAREQSEAQADGRLEIRATDFDKLLRDQGASEEMLNDVERIQEKTKKFGEKTLKAKVQPNEVLAAMNTIAADPRWRTAEVREQLREESSKAMALSELASAFTSTLRHLDEWDWPEEGVRIEIQRHLNGKERQHLDLDVNLAIFLEVISTRWIEHFKLHLEQLRTSKGWSKSTIVDTAVQKFPKEDVLKYKLALQDMTTYDSDLPRDGLKARFLNRQEEEILQVVSTGMGGGYEGGGYGDGVQDDRKTKAKAIRASKNTDSEVTTDVDAAGWHSAALSGKTARAYSHVFKMLCTDIRLLQTIDPDADITTVHLDIKDFGPSLDHSVPLAVFEYFGAPASWLKWLQTFLQVRVRCEDGSVVTSRTGTPFGLGFSSLMNELLLVILDMAIAAKTKLHVHRNHDDFWFWSQDKDQVVGAHEVMTEFARMAKFEWNEDKGGCCVVGAAGKEREVPPSLPQTPFRWGYLLLQSDGQWRIDQALLETRMVEAEEEMRSAKSFLGKVNVWNKYQAFIARNTALPLRANGVKHLEHVQDVLGQVQARVTGGRDILAWLRDELARAFPDREASNNRDVPNAMYLWPLDLGGFELHSQIANIATHIEHMVAADKENDRLPPFGSAYKASHERYKRYAAEWNTRDVYYRLGKVAKNPTSSEGARWASTMVQSHQVESWTSKDTCPPFLSLEAFIAIEAATFPAWDIEYSDLDLDQSQAVSEGAYKEIVQSLYKSSLIDSLGQSDQIVPADLAPKYALLDLQRAVKQLFK